MAHPLPDSNTPLSPIARPGREEFGARLFSVVMFGVCAVILLMAIFGDW